MNDPFEYMWPHIDRGKSQHPCNNLEYVHGEGITHDGKHFGIFRLADKEYDKEWLREHLPSFKEEWNRRQNDTTT